MIIEDYSRYAAVILGVSAIGCALGIGSYIIASSFTYSLLLLAIASWITVFASTIILIYGTIKIHRKSALRGGLANTTAGIVMAILWLYFYYGFILLPQFGFITSLLFIPALLSALLGFASFQRRRARPTHAEHEEPITE